VANQSYGVPGLVMMEGTVHLTAALGSIAHSGAKVAIGKGMYILELSITSIEIASHDEVYSYTITANTRAASTTWKEIAQIGPYGAYQITGKAGDDNFSTASSKIYVGIYNPYDFEIRARQCVDGTIASGINTGIKVYTSNLLPA